MRAPLIIAKVRFGVEAKPDVGLPKPAPLPQGNLMMLDHVDFFNLVGCPEGSGSLGLEAVIQLLKRTVLSSGPNENFSKPCPRSPSLDEPLTWTCRYQVLTPEFRWQMVEHARAGRSVEELARAFESSARAIRNRVAQADRDDGRQATG